MSTHTTLIPAPPIPSVAIARYVEMGKDAMRESKSKRTRGAYASDWKMFSRWCERHHERALPASAATVVAYLSFMAEAGRKIATMSRALVSINLAHQAAECESPVGSLPVREAMKGFKRLLGVAQRKKTPLLLSDPAPHLCCYADSRTRPSRYAIARCCSSASLAASGARSWPRCVSRTSSSLTRA